MVLVDSSIWIEAARRQGDLMAKLALRALLDEYEAAWCSPVKLEVLGGARREERRALESFFSCIPYVACNESDWEAAKALGWRARDAGHTLPWNDYLISATAAARGWRLYGRDAHFATLSGLGGAFVYQPGYGGTFAPEDKD
ncbi:putative nucleic acid-binding protein [Opitutaceae bacterium TAV1]|nr:twitching motility protein PilT [Opitutaceae bacterium TAV5]EIP98048.1 putative nucleic acid-binding protein [Opitutaceae bacterium TAV1]